MYLFVMLAALPGQFVDSPTFTKAQQQTAFEATVRTYHPASRSVGTAVAVGKKGPLVYFLTAAHLVPPKAIPGRETEDVRNVEMYLYKTANRDRVSSEAIAKVMARMPNEDLAVLAVELPNSPTPVPVCPKNMRIFRLPMTVMTIGAIQDGPPEIQLDTVKTKKLLNKPDGTEALYWEADIPQHQGRSGGPMIGANGFVIGIASGTWHQKGYYTYVSEIYRSLADNGYGWLVDKSISEK